MKSCVIILLHAFEFGVALSFNSRLRSCSVGPSASCRYLRNLAPLPRQHQQRSITSLLSLPPENELSTSEKKIAIQKRRAFLSNFAATSLLPIITSVNPAPVSAWGFPNNENGPLVYGADDIMSPKEHGTTSLPVQENLRYGVSRKLADKICSFNRMFAENSGYFQGTSFEDDIRQLVASSGGPVTFYDSVTGKPLFKAPVHRSVDDFIAESEVHGWPSFRDDEVVWDNVRVLKSSGETVSTSGTHLGHNLPDKRGNRYCINLVSVAGNPA